MIRPQRFVNYYLTNDNISLWLALHLYVCSDLTFRFRQCLNWHFFENVFHNIWFYSAIFRFPKLFTPWAHFDFSLLCRPRNGCKIIRTFDSIFTVSLAWTTEILVMTIAHWVIVNERKLKGNKLFNWPTNPSSTLIILSKSKSPQTMGLHCEKTN